VADDVVKRPAKQPLVILGTGLFVPEVADLAEESGRFEVTAFIENWDVEKTREPFHGKPVVWIDDAAPLAETHETVCGLGTTHRHGFIARAAALGFRFATIVHGTACVSRTSTIGEGSIISAGSIIAAHSRIGRHVIVNRGVLIGHHTTIHDYVTISPGANIAGAVTIDEGAYVGMGAIVVDRITIGAHAVVAAGSVVTRSVPARVQVTGMPARVTKRDIDGR
jgi:sugar O-acyltransferase (sialic acid O-acetyltransferase NeuD family)